MKTVFLGLGITFLWWLGLINGLYMEPGESVPDVLIYLTGASWLVALLGALALWSGKHKPGFILVIIGSICFVPLGLITVYGLVAPAAGVMMPRSTSAAHWLKKTHAETHSDIEGSNVSTISQGQEFYAKTQARLMLGVGGVALALGLFMAVSFTTAPVAPIGLGGLMVGMGCWFHFSPVARIGADYLVFQPAPLARTRTILDSEVERVERKKKCFWCIIVITTTSPTSRLGSWRLP
ncbi:hypothetical protein [Salinicola tamaricis]|uniref:hypothetical protein n=1 Tax=Salinicola tamaricis TaxID=1771309 RepID=UPI000D0A8B61|nr:hypothetical protein [Salinicola tamaricis]